MKSLRHGDIPFHPFNGKVEGEKIEHKGSFVFALGETTGHKHVIRVPKLEDMELVKQADGSILVTLFKAGTLTHEEHKTIEIPKGIYRIGKEREVDHFAGSVTRKVID